MDAFGGDEESAELRKLLAEIADDPDQFETWEKAVRTAEGLEGGINRNSSSQAITTLRDVYDRFLAKFPLFFGYWKKYADLEFSIAGTEAAEMVYERGVASITNSVDLWTNYCSFKTETSHDAEIIRDRYATVGIEEDRELVGVWGVGTVAPLDPDASKTLPLKSGLRELVCVGYTFTCIILFERGAGCVGLDFLSHPFWDKYMEFEERMEQPEKIFILLGRVITIPMHQYARYFERYKHLSGGRPLTALIPVHTLTQIQMDVENEGAGFKAGRSPAEVERSIRDRIDGVHLETFHKTQAETTKRWTYESEIKRPYFHVTDLDESQLTNWRKYLDFEESEGDYSRVQFLYERCLVTCAMHEEFWLRYARWMLAQAGKDEEVRNIYQRASCIYVPIALPTTRLHYAYFEEMSGRVDIAKDIHEAILVQLPSHVETIVSLANTARRHGTIEDAVAVYRAQIESAAVDVSAKAALVSEWAKLLWKVRGSPDEGRAVFQSHQRHYSDSDAFWKGWLQFETGQPGNVDSVKKVVNEILSNQKLGEKQQLITMYMEFLLERGDGTAAREFLSMDRDMNGPSSVKRAPVMTKQAGAPNGPTVMRYS